MTFLPQPNAKFIKWGNDLFQWVLKLLDVPLSEVSRDVLCVQLGLKMIDCHTIAAPYEALPLSIVFFGP